MVGATRYGDRISLLVATLFAFILSIPSVFAAPFDNISKAMGTVWNAIGSLFSFQYVSGSPAIQEGILKFLIFIMLLRVVGWALGKMTGKAAGSTPYFDPKTANIIGFVVAAVTVIFTPNVFIFSSIILLLVPVLFTVLAFVWVFSTGKTGDKPTNPWAAAFILFILFLLLQFLQESVYTRGNIAVGKMYPFTQTVMDLLILITIVVFVWKLLAAIFTIGKGMTADGIKNAIKNTREVLDTPVIAAPPSRPREVTFKLKDPASVALKWEGPLTGETVERYWIQHRYGDVWIGWNTIEKNRPNHEPHELVVSSIENAPLQVTRAMQFRVCASGRHTVGGWGEWCYSEVRAPAPEFSRPLNGNENAELQREQPVNPELERENQIAAADDAARTPRPHAQNPNGAPTGDDIIAPPAGADETQTPPPAPNIPSAPEGSAVTPETAGQAETDGNNLGGLEDEGTGVIKGATQSGITPDTPAKWQDPNVRAALQQYATKAKQYRDALLQHNTFLRRDPRQAVGFRNATDSALNAIAAYCAGNPADVTMFRQVVVAVATLQMHLERIVMETLVDVEANLAATMHTKGSDSAEFKTLEHVRVALVKRREAYEHFCKLLGETCPEALHNMNLQLPQTVPQVFGAVLRLPDDQLPAVRMLATEANARSRSWMLLWSDDLNGLVAQEDFRRTTLIRWVAETFAAHPGGVGKGMFVDGLRKQSVLFTPSEEEIAMAIRDVESCISGEYIATILPPVSPPPSTITQMDNDLSGLEHDINKQGPMTQDDARTILGDYRALLNHKLLSYYAYPAKTKKERDTRVQETYGKHLNALATLVEQWTPEAPALATALVSELNMRLRSDLQRVLHAIDEALKKVKSKDKRADLNRDARWTHDFQERLARIEATLQRTSSAITAHPAAAA